MAKRQKIEQARRNRESDKAIFEHMDRSILDTKRWNEDLQEFKAIYGQNETREKVIRWRASSYYDGKRHPIADWIYGKEIRVFRMPDVSKRVVPYVTNGIEDLIQQIGLDFNVNYFGSHPSAVEQVREATRLDGKLDTNKLFKLAENEHWRKPEYGGSPHADVFITSYSFKPHFGCANYNKGAMILGLPKNTDLSFIRRLAKHETGAHLLRYAGSHHDQWKECRDPNWGYKPVPDCNTLWQATTSFTCKRCADAIYYFWKGIEDKTGKRFFKKGK